MQNSAQYPDLVGWFDMPVSNLERAVTFYQAVIGREVKIEAYEQFRFGIFAHSDKNAGCLVPTDKPITGENTIMIYLNVDGRIRDAVAKTLSLEGTVVEDVHPIGPYGFRAIIIDTEGNKVALHSHSDQ